MIDLRRFRTWHSPRRRRSVAAWLGMVLVLLNAVGAAALPAAAADNGPAPFLAGLDGERIVLCTPGGVRVIDPHTGEEAPLQGPSGAHGFCVWCLPLTNPGTAATATPVVLPLPALPPRHAVLPAPSQRPNVATLGRANAARAPPAA